MTDGGSRTDRFRTVLAAAVPAAVVIGALAVVARTRPGLGWGLLLGVTAVTGLVFLAVGEDLRAEHRVANVGGFQNTGESADDRIASDSSLRPNAGTIAHFCLWTAMLGLGYFFTYVVFLR